MKATAEEDRSLSEMRASVGALWFSFLCACVAEVNGAESPPSGPACPAACDQQSGVQLRGVLEDLQARLAAAEEQLEALRNTIQGSRVAFGAALGNDGHVGPIRAETPLIYKTVYMNTGAYDPETGIFTAPVGGVYYFSVTGHSLSSNPMGLRLMRFARQMAAVKNYEAGERFETASNSMILRLGAGDQIRVWLTPMTWVYDDGDSLSTFTGHLLFPM
ncbi:complement C1q-like protein 2 [Betta splendens]|uniref:Complement C1q-like protein 2 n=1 Tax=Betta splendens TaxID=158456 RepID=A0A6P7KWR6_BETSP|nr:complement C1q-like protein 2 [Betta splendens]